MIPFTLPKLILMPFRSPMNSNSPMLKQIFSFLILSIFCFSFLPLQITQSTDPWKEILTMKSSRDQTQDVLSDSIHSRSKLLKIRYESELDPKFETGSFRIGCYRSYGNKSCYESIVPRTDCNYYVYEEAFIYGWELGYSDYQFNVKSDGMDWTITVFEYEDYEKEPYFVERGLPFIVDYTKEEHDRCRRNQGKYPEKTKTISLSPESGVIRLQYYAVAIPGAYSREYSIIYSISSNPGFNYSIGYNRGYTIHFKKGATITFHVMVKGYEAGIKFFDPKFDF
jgi:hypothetical protein